MNTKLQAIIFDIDGTLIDTREFILQSFEHTLKVTGHIVPSREQIRASIGYSLEECYRRLTNRDDTSSLCDIHRSFQMAHFDLIKPYPNLVETLNTLRNDLNLKTAVWSTRKVTLNESLKRVDIFDLFDCIISGDNVINTKPHPEGMLEIINQLKLGAKDCIYIGDTVVDIAAGKNSNAGLTIGITHGFGSKEELHGAGADLIIDSLAELTDYLKKM